MQRVEGVEPLSPIEPAAFLTGSRVYGTPGPDSDWDLVVPCCPDDADLLIQRFPAQDGQTSVQGSIKVGSLNLLLVTTAAEYQAWRVGTDALIAQRPVTRKEACRTFDELRVALIPGTKGGPASPAELCRILRHALVGMRRRLPVAAYERQASYLRAACDAMARASEPESAGHPSIQPGEAVVPLSPDQGVTGLGEMVRETERAMVAALGLPRALVDQRQYQYQPTPTPTLDKVRAQVRPAVPGEPAATRGRCMACGAEFAIAAGLVHECPTPCAACASPTEPNGVCHLCGRRWGACRG